MIWVAVIFIRDYLMGGAVIAYNPTNNSLFIVGHVNNQQVGEISIPDLHEITSGDLSGLSTATSIQNLSDITEGNLLNLKADGGPILVNGVRLGGLIKYGNKLIGGLYAYYDGDLAAVKSHFTSSTVTIAIGDFEGMFEAGSKPDPVPQAGFVGGYMAPIPETWQSALAEKYLLG